MWLPVLAGVIWPEGRVTAVLVAAAAAGLALELARLLGRAARRMPAEARARAAWAAAALAATGGWLAADGAVIRVLALPVLAGLVVAWTLRAYIRPNLPLSRAQRIGGILCRLTALGAALVIVAGPQWRVQSVVFEQPCVLLVQDASASLQLPASPGPGLGGSRYAAALAAWHRADGELGRLAERAQVHAATVGSGREERPVATGRPVWPEQADQSRTAWCDGVGEAVGAALGRGMHLAGVVLVSDGADNASRTWTAEALGAWLAAERIPVIAVDAGGGSAATSRVAIQAVVHPSRSGLNRRLTVQVDLLAVGLAGRRVDVDLTVNGRSVARQQVAPTSAREICPVTLAFAPDATGLVELAVHARVDGESEPSASQVSYVQVADDKLRVLAVEAKPRPEFAALVRCLSADPLVDLTSLVALSAQPGSLQKVSRLPVTAADWRRYDVVVLGDVPAARWTSPALAGLADAIRAGTGLVMLGGLSNYPSYAGTALEAVLPIHDLAGTTQWAEPIRLLVPPEADAEPLAALDDDGRRAAAAWAAVPALPGAVRFPGLKPAARELLSGQRADGRLAGPMAAWQQVGTGRVLALAMDQTWTWARAHAEGGAWLARFWSQAVAQVSPRQGQVFIASDRATYDADDLRSGRARIQVSAGAAGLPAGATLLARWQGPTSRPAVTTGPEAAELALSGPLSRQTGVLGATLGGWYTLQAVARVEGREVAQAQSILQIVEHALETEEPTADPGLLAAVVQPTAALGGRVASLADLPAALSALAGPTQRRQRDIVQDTPLVGAFAWPLFVVALTALTTEWLLRRRWGVV